MGRPQAERRVLLPLPLRPGPLDHGPQLAGALGDAAVPAKRPLLAALIAATFLALIPSQAPAQSRGGVESLHPAPRGGVVIAGHRGFGQYSGAYRTVIARFGERGRLDRSLGPNGRLSVAPESLVALQADGKFLVASSVPTSPRVDLEVRRYLHDGRPDRDFANRGVYRANTGLADEVAAIAVGPDGQIIVATNNSGSGPPLFNEVMLRRLTPRGFEIGSSSFYTQGFKNLIYLDALALGPGKGVTVSGAGPRRRILVRFTAGLRIDPTFSGGGVLEIRRGASGLAASRRRIAVAGTADGVRAFLRDGTRAPAYSGATGASCPVAGEPPAPGMGRRLAFDPRGRILALGGEGECGLVRFTRRGRLDRTFGAGGFVPVAPASRRPTRAALGLDARGRILVGYYKLSDGSVRIRRYGPNGRLDRRFGHAGVTGVRLASGSRRSALR